MSPLSSQPIPNWGGTGHKDKLGASQQTRLLFRETSAMRASQGDGNPPPVLGSPERIFMMIRGLKNLIREDRAGVWEL